jgi:predicted GIY-YIG superfamily endonuclease
MVYIYALKDPNTGKIRYVGQTADLRQRLAGHISQRSNQAMQPWIEALRREGQRPILIVLEEVLVLNADDRERWWFEQLTREGERLLNVMRDRSQTHDLLNIRVPPELKRWLEEEVRRRRQMGDWKATITSIVVEMLEQAKATSADPVLD